MVYQNQFINAASRNVATESCFLIIAIVWYIIYVSWDATRSLTFNQIHKTLLFCLNQTTCETLCTPTTSCCSDLSVFQLLKPLWDFKTIKPQTEVHCCSTTFLKAACEKGTYSKNNDLLAGILWLWGDKINQCEKWRWHFEIKSSVFCDSVLEVCFETKI